MLSVGTAFRFNLVLLITSSLVSSGFFSGSKQINLEWSEGAPPAIPNAGAMSGLVDGKIILAGGTYWKDAVKVWASSVQVLDLDQGSWSTIESLPRSLAYGVGVSDKKILYVLGGADDKKVYRDCLRLVRNDGRNRWETFSVLPDDRVYAAALYLDGSIYLIGGASHPDRLDCSLNSVLALDLKHPGNGWKSIAPLPGPPRSSPAAAVSGDSLYVFGGCYQKAVGGEIVNLSDAYRYLPKRGIWERLNDAPYAARDWTAASSDGESIFLFGGYGASAKEVSEKGPNIGFQNRVVLFDRKTGDYREMNPMPYAVAGLQCFFYRGAFYGATGEHQIRGRFPWTVVGKLVAR